MKLLIIEIDTIDGIADFETRASRASRLPQISLSWWILRILTNFIHFEDSTDSLKRDRDLSHYAHIGDHPDGSNTNPQASVCIIADSP